MMTNTTASARKVAPSVTSINRLTLRRAADADSADSGIALNSLMTEPLTETILISADDNGGRLDRVLASRVPSLSRSRIKTLILDGRVAVGSDTIRDPAHQVKSGERVTLAVPEAEPAEPQG